MVKLQKLTFVISLLLAVLLLYTSGLKLWIYASAETGFEFFPFVKDYHVVVFWMLMICQLLISGFLFLNKTRLMGSYGAFFLLSSLSTYLYLMLHYAVEIPCFCTGIIPGLSWEGHLWFTMAFATLAGINIMLLPKDIHARE